MRRILRDALAKVREAGGTDVRIVEAGRHTEVAFVLDGRPAMIRLHRGGKVRHRAARGLRSALRRALSS